MFKRHTQVYNTRFQFLSTRFHQNLIFGSYKMSVDNVLWLSFSQQCFYFNALITSTFNLFNCTNFESIKCICSSHCVSHTKLIKESLSCHNDKFIEWTWYDSSGCFLVHRGYFFQPQNQSQCTRTASRCFDVLIAFTKQIACVPSTPTVISIKMSKAHAVCHHIQILVRTGVHTCISTFDFHSVMFSISID